MKILILVSLFILSAVCVTIEEIRNEIKRSGVIPACQSLVSEVDSAPDEIALACQNIIHFESPSAAISALIRDKKHFKTVVTIEEITGPIPVEGWVKSLKIAAAGHTKVLEYVLSKMIFGLRQFGLDALETAFESRKIGNVRAVLAYRNVPVTAEIAEKYAMRALERDDWEMFQFFMSVPMNSNQINKILLIAVFGDKLDVVQWLTTQLNIQPEVIIHMSDGASRRDSINVVKYLNENKIRTPELVANMFSAACGQGSQKVAEYFSTPESRFVAPQGLLVEMFHVAVKAGHVEVVKILIKMGVKLDQEGRMALRHSVSLNNMALLELLVESNAPVLEMQQELLTLAGNGRPQIYNYLMDIYYPKYDWRLAQAMEKLHPAKPNSDVQPKSAMKKSGSGLKKIARFFTS